MNANSSELLPIERAMTVVVAVAVLAALIFAATTTPEGAARTHCAGGVLFDRDATGALRPVLRDGVARRC